MRPFPNVLKSFNSQLTPQSILSMFNKAMLQRRTFHYSRRLCEEWTKAGLRRMKKTDLVHLAKQNYLDTSGTKNEIIIHLLGLQTAKIVGSTTPTLHSIRKVVEKSVDVPEDVVNADIEWTKAFEMKTAQRGSRKPLSDSRDHFTSSSSGSSKPHPLNDAVKSTIVKPAVQQLKSTTPTSATAELLTEKLVMTKETHKQQAARLSDELEGMDPAWVEAFDLKVESRGARHHLTDTLSPSTPILTALSDELSHVKAAKPEKEHGPSTTDGVKKDIDEKRHSGDGTPSNSNDTHENAWISTIFGTSMLAWYIGGEKGIANIWHFFTS